MEKDIPNVDSEDAALGTAQHECAAFCLRHEYPGYSASKCIGMKFHDIEIDEEMAEYVQVYVDQIRELSEGFDLFVEQRLPIGHITLEPNGFGTGDAIIIQDTTLCVSDAKFGYNKVYARRNPQLMLYALGALHLFGALFSIEKVVLRIHQPRIEHYDEWECSRAELEEFADEMRFKAQFVWRLLRGEVQFKPDEDLVPSDKACQWCRAKASCPKLMSHSLAVISDDFTDLTSNPVAKFENALAKLQTIDNNKLSHMMHNVDLIEDLCKAIRKRVTSELLAGHAIPGFKLVQGKKGHRKWDNEKLVEKTLKDWRSKQSDIYNMKVISPADAEKLFKDDPKRWEKVVALYTQNSGSPSVAPSTDPRPALEVGAHLDDFDVIEP